MPEDHTITLELEGMPEENGGVPFESLLGALTALKGFLKSFDKWSSGKEALYYRVWGMQLTQQPQDVVAGNVRVLPRGSAGV